MTSTAERLVPCFTTVFPALAATEAPLATVDNTQEWDSSHHLLLMQVIEEEFGVQIPEEVVGEIDSFAGYEQYLVAKV